ncbi:MAG: AraC family transcriptional regulator [Thermodesulfobacteriota bacterium]
MPRNVSANGDYRQRMLRVLVHIEDHLDDEPALSLDDLAGVACFSRYHFHRIFTGMVGESVRSYIRRILLERAAHQLTYTDHSVLDVAVHAGYDSHAAFTRAFRASFSVPPEEFRKRARSRGLSPDPERRFRAKRNLAERGECSMKVEIRDLPPMRVAFVRHVGPYDTCEVAWQRLCGWAMSKGLLGPDTLLLGVCHDDPEITPPEKIRYDASMVVHGDVRPEGEIGVKEVGNGKYAVTLHKGPYSGLSRTYAELCGRWASEKGVEIAAGPSLEFYKNTPENTPPEGLITEICVPLA